MGGWYLYAFDKYDWALKPTKKLVFDAPITEEHWLVSYSADTRAYMPVQMAKMFVKSVTMSTRSGERSKARVDLCIEINGDYRLPVTSERDSAGNYLQVLTPGYWTVSFNHIQYRVTADDKLDVELTSMTKAQYLKAKGVSADLLNYQAPAYLDLQAT